MSASVLHTEYNENLWAPRNPDRASVMMSPPISIYAFKWIPPKVNCSMSACVRVCVRCSQWKLDSISFMLLALYADSVWQFICCSKPRTGLGRRETLTHAHMNIIFEQMLLRFGTISKHLSQENKHVCWGMNLWNGLHLSTKIITSHRISLIGNNQNRFHTIHFWTKPTIVPLPNAFFFHSFAAPKQHKSYTHFSLIH